MTARPSTAAELAALRATVEAVLRALERDRADLKERDAEASKSREDVRASLADLKSGHDDLLRRMDKVEPVTDMVTGFKAKVIGAMFVMGLIGSAILGFLAYFKTQIANMIWGA
jgi:chromosome segregation ATPase